MKSEMVRYKSEESEASLFQIIAMFDHSRHTVKTKVCSADGDVGDR